MTALDPGDIDRLAVESRRRQGLPDYVKDPATIARVVRLILAGAQMQAIGCRGWRRGNHRPRLLGASGQRDEHSRLIGKASHGAVGDVQHHFKRKQQRRPGKERGQAGDHPPQGRSPSTLQECLRRPSYTVTDGAQRTESPIVTSTRVP